MNSKIKSASIVLTGGVLLGWGSSAALAANVVGVGMYGTSTNPNMSEDAASDAVTYDNGYVTITFGSIDGISLDPRPHVGELVSVNVDTPGSGYDESEEAWQVIDNTDYSGRGAEWGYEVDNVIGYYGVHTEVWPARNADGNPMYGTGYIATTGAAQADTWVSGLDFTNDAGDAGPVCATADPQAGNQDTWVGGTFDAGLRVLEDADCAGYTASATAAREICWIDWNHGGIGYGVAGGVMDFYVHGVLSTDYVGTYTTNADGGINSVDITVNAAPVEGYPTNRDQVTMMPRDSTGTGWDPWVGLWGEFSDWDHVTNGEACTQVAVAHALEDALMNNCTDCDIVALVDVGEGCVLEVGSPAIGAVVSAFHRPGFRGFNYDAAPPVSIDAAGITVGSGATFTAIVGEDDTYLTWEDGMPVEFDYDDDVSLYCGADYNDDDHADIVAHGTIDGYGDTICLLLGDNGVVEEVVELGESGTNWHIAGQLDRGGADFADGHCLLWRNNTTGGNAVWVCNGDGVVEKSLIEAAAAEDWFCYSTNDSMGGGSRAYWYSHYGDNAMWYMDIDTDHSDWVTEMDYLRNDEGEQVNTGSGAGWEMEAVGCLSGDPRGPENGLFLADGDNNLSRDIVWFNAGTGAVCIWLMDQDASGYINSRNYCTVGGHVYDGASGYGVADGYRCIGVGQYHVDTLFADPEAPHLDPGAREQTFGSLWWNHAGETYCWKMDRTIDLEAWGPGGNTGGTGLPEYPETVSAYERY